MSNMYRMSGRPASSSFVWEEGAVGDDALFELDARALRARVTSLGREQHAGLRHLLVELPHRGHELLAREHARPRILVGLDQHHESHRGVSFLPTGRTRGL